MIVVRELTKTFGQTTVLKDVRLSIGPGEFVALMGESGSGKSTLLNLISGIDHPDAGVVELGGVSLAGWDDDRLTRLRREKIGFVFQFFNLLEHLRVLENVEVPLLLKGLPGPEVRARSLDMLGRVGLEDRAEREILGLSGGERQRVAVARALVHRPEILIADEPTGSLDSRNGENILALIRGLARDAGVTVLMATHSAQVAAVADRVVSICDGSIESD